MQSLLLITDISSLAISRRVPPEVAGAGRGGRGGHASGGGRGGFDNSPRFRKHDKQQHAHQPRHTSPRHQDPPSVAVPPAVPGFGFQLPGF